VLARLYGIWTLTRQEAPCFARRTTFMWRGGQDQKIGHENPMSNTKDKNEPTDAEAVPLSRIVLHFWCPESSNSPKKNPVANIGNY
jgi:hypothetical protein